MVAIIPASEVSLSFLRTKFNLIPVTDKQFFSEWHADLPEISNSENQALERIKTNYLNLIEYPPMSEEAVKMVVLSPLLDLAGFYQYPFRITTEQSIEVELDDENTVIKGRIDVLVLKNELWILIIESKRAGISLEPGIPQALSYMLQSPQFPCFGFVVNGSNFIFIKLDKKKSPVYALSDELTLRRTGDLDKVLGTLKNLRSQLLQAQGREACN